MESKELKASVLADTIGVNRATISHILSGRNFGMNENNNLLVSGKYFC